MKAMSVPLISPEIVHLVALSFSEGTLDASSPATFPDITTSSPSGVGV